MKGAPRPPVIFAQSLRAARRAARGRLAALCASPRSPAALARALEDSLTVLAAAPRREKRFWWLAARRFLIPPAPPLLRHAIAGIAKRRSPDPGPARLDNPGERRANWIEGNLRDARARALLKEDDCPRLWIVEDFRRLKLSSRMHRRLEEANVRLAAFRPLAWRRLGRRAP